MAIEVWVKDSRRQYVKDNLEIVSYVGDPINLEEITVDNGWVNTGEPKKYSRDVVTAGISRHSETKYKSLKSVGMSDADARRLSGWEG